MENLYCDSSYRYGFQIKELKKWILPKWKSITWTCPIFFVVLVSSSLNGRQIPQELFNSLRNLIATEKKYVK
jgi:hypothetical protein